MQSPVKKPVWVFDFNPTQDSIISSYNALAEYSTLSKEDQNVYAIDQNSYLRKVKEQAIIENIYQEGDQRLEVWNYDPALLAKDEYVDPFSLYLIFQDNPDERVQIALEDMMENVL